MRNIGKFCLLVAAIGLIGCSLSPEQQAARESKRVKKAQNLQIQLAKQCDAETADLIEQKFNPPLSQTEAERQDFEKRYVEKVENPVFQACYKLALENYKVTEELEYWRSRYEDYPPRWGVPRFCYNCW